MASVTAHHLFVVTKALPCLNSYPDSIHKDFATAIANARVVASLSRDGRAFVFRSDIKNAQDLLTNCYI